MTLLDRALKPFTGGEAGRGSDRNVSLGFACPSLTFGGADAAGTAPFGARTSRKAAAARAARAEALRGGLSRTTLPLTTVAIVADAGTRCDRPAAVPHCCTGGPGGEGATTIATTPSATASASAVTTAVTLRTRGSRHGHRITDHASLPGRRPS